MALTPGVTRFQISEIGQKLKSLRKHVPPSTGHSFRVTEGVPQGQRSLLEGARPRLKPSCLGLTRCSRCFLARSGISKPVEAHTRAVCGFVKNGDLSVCSVHRVKRGLPSLESAGRAPLDGAREWSSVRLTCSRTHFRPWTAWRDRTYCA